MLPLSYVAVTFPFWTADNWTLSQTDWFSLNDHGILTVLQPGLYMIYAQVIGLRIFNPPLRRYGLQTVSDFSCSTVFCFSYYRQDLPQAALPVFRLLTGRFWGFSPRRGDTLHRSRSNLAGRNGP